MNSLPAEFLGKPLDYTLQVTNRFRGLDLIDQVPEDLWTEVQDTVQEAVIRTTPQKKKCSEGKWLREEASHTAEKGRETRDKAEKGRSIPLNQSPKTSKETQ